MEAKAVMLNPLEWSAQCTGSARTCQEPECLSCGVRECPFSEPLHYHQDGCPCCSFGARP